MTCPPCTLFIDQRHVRSHWRFLDEEAAIAVIKGENIARAAWSQGMYFMLTKHIFFFCLLAKKTVDLFVE